MKACQSKHLQAQKVRSCFGGVAVDAVEIGRCQLIMCLYGTGALCALGKFDLGFRPALVIIEFFARHVAPVFAVLVGPEAEKGSGERSASLTNRRFHAFRKKPMNVSNAAP